jgi:hypothetical protein
MKGYNIEGFREHIRQGRLLPHTHFEHYSSEGFGDGYYNILNNNNHLIALNTHNDPWKVWKMTYADIVSAATLDHVVYVQAAAAKISSQGWDALTFIAEIASLKRMFSGLLTKLGNLLQGKSLGRAADLWLEGRYGWRTLIYDIQDFNKALSNMKEQRTRFSERVGMSTSKTNVVTTPITGADVLADIVTIDVIETSARGSVTADIVVPPFRFNVVNTAWELIPFSFVIDWFVSVGKALDAADFISSSSNYSASGGTSVTITRSMTLTNVRPRYSYITVYDVRYDAQVISKYEIRQPMSVSIRPQFRLNLDKLKLIDILSLILQRARRN